MSRIIVADGDGEIAGNIADVMNTLAARVDIDPLADNAGIAHPGDLLLRGGDNELHLSITTTGMDLMVVDPNKPEDAAPDAQVWLMTIDLFDLYAWVSKAVAWQIEQDRIAYGVSSAINPDDPEAPHA